MEQLFDGSYDFSTEVNKFRTELRINKTSRKVPEDSHIGQGGSIKVQLQGNMHINYLGSIFLGVSDTEPASSQEAKVQYDTGSSWLAVSSSLCDNCDYIAYDLHKTITEVTNNYQLESEKFGNSEIKGQRVMDNVCLSNINTDTEGRTCID